MKINSNIYNNISRIQNNNRICNSYVSFTSKNQGKELSDSLDALSLLNKSLVKKKITITPKPFFDESFGEDTKSILTSSNNIKWKYVHQNGDYIRIKPEYKPKTLNILDENISTEHLSNLTFPYGSLALSSDLNGNISTDGLWQCAAASIVDKKHNLQTLLHFCPGVPNTVNDKLLEHILSVSHPKNLEVTVVPGCYSDTDLTIDYLVNKINDFSKGAKIKFANFPDNEHETLILKNGKLYASDYKNVIKDINPVDRLSFATSFFM